MSGTSMLVLFACMPAFASSQFMARPQALQAQGAKLPVQANRNRLPVVNSFAPMYAPLFAPSFAEGDGKDKAPSYGYSAPASASYGYSAPASGEFAGMTQDQIDFIRRKRGEVGFGGGLDTHGRPSQGGSAAPAAASANSGEFAGMTQDQIDFIKRKRGEIGMDGGLDTHGRPRHGGSALPDSRGVAPTAAASASSGEFAGMTQDQIDFIRRKRGELAMSGGLDTHGRPRHLDAQESSSGFGILAAGLLGLFTCSGVILAVVRMRHSASDEFREPYIALTA